MTTNPEPKARLIREGAANLPDIAIADRLAAHAMYAVTKLPNRAEEQHPGSTRPAAYLPR